MRQSTRLILNTLITYARMALTVGIGLAVTRLALRLLGQDDFGLMATLGASGALLLVVSDALTTSTQRHIAYEIGREDHQTLREVFNTALALFSAVSLGAVAVGLACWPLLALVVDLPEGREHAAAWVYVLTLINLAVTVLGTPHRGYLVARQSIWAIALYDLSQSALGLVAVLLLFLVDSPERLLAYAAMLLGVRVIAEGAVIAIATLFFDDCRPRLSCVRRRQFPRIASFAGWNLIAYVSWRLRVQGSTILFNAFYGSAVTAAFGVASQLGGYQSQVGASILRVITPAMTSIEAKGGVTGVRRLTMVSSKYLTLLTLFVMIPALIEMDQLLNLWLADVPAHTSILARLVLISSALTWISIGHQLALEAKGDIARYSILMAVFDAAVLILQLLTLIAIGRAADGRPAINPWILPAINLLVMVLQSVARVLFVDRKLGTAFSHWLRDVLAPCTLVALVATAAGLLPALTMHASPWRLLAVTLASAAVTAPLAWLLALAPWEREHFLRVASRAARLGRSLQAPATNPAVATTPIDATATTAQAPPPRAGEVSDEARRV